MKRLITFLLLFLAMAGFTQGVTTSSMTGTITDSNKEPLIGANIVAVHTPSGTFYGTSTDVDGSFSIPNMRVGGPYTITLSYTGFSEQSLTNVYLRLGENFDRDFTLSESSVELDLVEVIGQSGNTGQNVGSSTQISTETIEGMPTLDRNINDYLKLTPQASVIGDGISFAGTNNRFNAIYIDGAVNNDVFGLSASGTNGGQTGISPVSMDIIDQFQVVLSPYDVSLGGFAGGGINAVTKSGTNKFQGTAYYFLQNQNLAGKTNQKFADAFNIDERTKLAEYKQTTYGASLGGPIKKDKVFFFTNFEIQDDETPRPFTFQQYGQTAGRVTEAQLNSLSSFLKEQYGYDAGTFGTTSDQLQGIKWFGKLDFNINQNNKLTLRHNLTKAEQFDRNVSSANAIQFSNNGVYFPTTTNSSALELNTRLGMKMSNNLIIGYTNVNDDRDAIGQDFPGVIINDVGGGSINLGTEAFSSANQLTQSIFTLTDNFKFYSKSHTFTVGTHNEFYSIYNVFIPQNYGVYRFASLNDFLSGAPAIEYDRSYSLVDNITGDGTKAAAEFNAMQLGLYAQDEWSVSKSFNLTYGVRLDLPIITSDPVEDTNFNTVALPKMKAQYPDLADNIQAGSAPDGQLMISPRVGFQYNPGNERTTIVRGGVGIFTSRIPFVWPGAMFNNNGLTQGFVDERSLPNRNAPFIADVANQYTNPNFSIPSGDINIFTQDFKYPQVLRSNLAIDQKLPGGINATIEGIFTKTLNNVVYTNINNDISTSKTWNSVDQRVVYPRRNIDNTYSAVYVGSNTSEGYSYNVSATLDKTFNNGLSAMFAYTYGDAYSINDGTSSQNSSQWRGQVNINGRNNPVYGRSDYALGSRVIGNLAYRKAWTADKGFATTVSIFYNGQNDQAFSYIIAGNSARNIANESGSTSRNRTLVYVPSQQSDINLVPYTSGGETISAADQWSRLNSYIESDPSLASKRGDYAEKNGGNGVFNHRFDLSIRQDLGKKFGEKLNRLQVSLDIFNFANLLNSSWGTQYFLPGDFNNVNLYEFIGYESDGVTPRFNYRGPSSRDDLSNSNIADRGSRWRGRIGIRYLFD